MSRRRGGGEEDGRKGRRRWERRRRESRRRERRRRGGVGFSVFGLGRILSECGVILRLRILVFTAHEHAYVYTPWKCSAIRTHVIKNSPECSRCGCGMGRGIFNLIVCTRVGIHYNTQPNLYDLYQIC